MSAGVEAEVGAYGQEQWEEIARLGGSGRSGHECWLEWLHRLRPSLNLGPWSPAEDARLVHLQKQHGMHNVSTHISPRCAPPSSLVLTCVACNPRVTW